MVDMSTTTEVMGDMDFSLAELAMMNTDEIKVLTSRLPMAGIWTVFMKEVKLGKFDAKPEEDKPALPFIAWTFESVNIEPVKKSNDFDPATTIGRRLSKRATIWPNNFADEIGYVKGDYKKCGFDTSGRLGGMTEQEGEPGWLDGPVLSETLFRMRVRHGTRDGQDVAYIDWLGPIEDKVEESDAA